jgi:general secretion pathway protein F
MEAGSRSAAVARLRSLGQVPIRVDEITGFSLSGFRVAALWPAYRLPPRALALISSQLSVLLEAGLPLDEALGALAETIDIPAQRRSLLSLRDGVRGGSSLADAIAAQQNAFPPFYVSMVRAGEAGASLEAVLGRLGHFLERTEATKEHIKSALLYPIIVAITCVASISILFIFVVPRFRPLFEQAGAALPLPARALLATSDAFIDFWWMGVLGSAVLLLTGAIQLRNANSRRRWETRMLNLPLIGDIVRKSEIVTFARTLATLLKNGVPLVSALSIVQGTMRTRGYAQALEGIIDEVKTGKGLARPMSATKTFPKLVVQLVNVGEESGRQEEMLSKVADIFEADARRRIDRMLALLGPAMTIVLGLIVAGVIGSILTAVLSVYDLAI